MGNFLAAQGFLARAADQDSSLAEVRYDYIFDNELNFLNLSLGTNVPGDWKFATQAERSAFYVSGGAAILLLWRIIRRTAYESGRETLIGRIFGSGQERYGGSIARYWARVRDGWLRISRLGSPSHGWWLVTPLALVVSALVLVIAEGWSLLWEGSVSRLVMVATLLYVAFVSLLVHHAGHAVVALRSGLQVREAPWLAGIAQAIVLGALSGPFIAPMPATSVEGEAEERRRQLVFFAGPLASIFMALLLYALYLASHVPLFNFGAVLNVALAAASLLSLPPLEGTEISEGYYTRWAFWAAIFVTVITALIASSGYF
jgi:Zn-dependent protease